MTELPVGAYEQIVTDGLHRQLGRLEPDLVERIRLDPADADEILARHVAALTRRALRAVPGQGADRLAGQVASTVHLFVRETREADGALGAPPYLYAGPMTYVQHTGDRSMRILWRLRHALPADVFHAARVAAG